MKALNVWWDGRLVGTFEQTKGGALAFAYAASWLGDERALSRYAAHCRRAS